MENWKLMVKEFLSNEEGATAVEYGLMVALIAAALVAVVSALEQGVENAFTTTTTALG